jgi:hypothetical protein
MPRTFLIIALGCGTYWIPLDMPSFFNLDVKKISVTTIEEMRIVSKKIYQTVNSNGDQRTIMNIMNVSISIMY